MDADEVADELYGLLPEEFVARRRERAVQARAAGDRDLAAAVLKLPRPTMSAWLVNSLVRADPRQVGEFLDVGAALRDAQAQLAAGELRALSSQRHALVSALVQAARRLAADHGHRVSDSVERELEDTLNAALADPAATDLVRSGRLARALHHAGLGPVELAGAAPSAAPAGPGARRRFEARPAATAMPGPAAAQRRDQSVAQHVDEDERRGEQEQRRKREKLRAARQSLADAEQNAEDARHRLHDSTAAAATAQGQLELLRQRITELAAQLDAARRDEKAAIAAAAAAQRRRAEATRTAERTEQRRARAQDELDELDEPGEPGEL